MKFLPQHPDIQRHVDHFWIVEDGADLFAASPPLHEFPGLSPEMILVFDGHYTISYRGKRERVSTNKLYGFLHQDVVLDFSKLRSFAIVRFQARNLSSLLPFIRYGAEKVMKDPVFAAAAVFSSRIDRLVGSLKGRPAATVATELESFLLACYRSEREGFVAELAVHSPGGSSPREIMARTNYSYATLERHFKRDTGLTPKKFQTLRRFRNVVNELNTTGNTEWLHYVATYGYFDQSHFIKEIKKFSGLTPSQILRRPNLHNYRPGES